jgi:hypothetical protein
MRYSAANGRIFEHGNWANEQKEKEMVEIRQIGDDWGNEYKRRRLDNDTRFEGVITVCDLSK